MALDVVAFCISGNLIDNGGIIVNAPRGQTGLVSNYQINTYSTVLPTTGTIYGNYDTRFTGLAPCDDCTDAIVLGTGGPVIALFV
mgnify:FL=1